MQAKPLVFLAFFLISPALVADDIIRDAGRAAGSFGVGITDAILDAQPRWITVAPRERDECLKESSGQLDNRYVRCRNGYQAYARSDGRGGVHVLQERPIPMH